MAFHTRNVFLYYYKADYDIYNFDVGCLKKRCPIVKLHGFENRYRLTETPAFRNNSFRALAVTLQFGDFGASILHPATNYFMKKHQQ